MSASSNVLDSSEILLVGADEWIPKFVESMEAQSQASIQSVATADDALDYFHEGSIDCLICEYTLEGSTGIDLLHTIRNETTTLPIILCTASGNESVASEAIGAGVTDYIAYTESSEQMHEELLERAERSIRSARRTTTQRDRARQFDAIFHDTRTATWVLDPDGSLARVNQTAQDMTEMNLESTIGQPFWTLPWWSATDDTQSDVRQILEKALTGDFGNAVIERSSATSGQQVLELSARPVQREGGEIVSIVVEGVDITERVALERDLRQSEELHRVTLNNMTDTVLITNEDGEYTYICPNVHFIFGYTDAEIREMGTIDELLGDDLFDRDDLAADGILKNIECTATDKAGREHTLLVNVREVSIQGGTLLFSCRDITKRKQREEALATLQGMARDFLYAQTPQEIAHHVVDDVPGVLDLDATAVYLFDSDNNELYPVVQTPAMERSHGPLPTIHADAEGITSYSFLEGESLFFDDVHDSERLENRATDIRSAAYIPLGDHGVFIVGSPDIGRFHEVTRELADLLAVTAEAALDRVRRESRLRKQDRELQHRNSQLTDLNRINEIIREIDQALVRAETRAEIEHAVCDLLTDDDRFVFAWIGVSDSSTETVEPRAWAGTERGYLDNVSFTIDDSKTEPAGRTVATKEVTTISNVAEHLRQEPWRKAALSRDYLSVLSVPLAYDEFTYGVLTVYAKTQNAFDETAKEVFAELGETIASATSAIERKNALLTTSMTRVEFDIDDPTFILSRLARKGECILSYQGGVQQTDAGTYVFVTVEGSTIETVEEAASDITAIDEVRRISGSDTDGVLRLRISQPFLALELADHGAILRSAVVDASTATLVIDVPESVDDRHIMRLVTNMFTDIELRSKQTVDRSATQNLHSEFLEQLTDRQLEVIQTAYYSGFFESPRESTGEEVAETLGISPPAFYQHSRTVQRKLFSTLFDELGVPASSEVTIE
ncbi:bacterio-opsin activator domain-containing protein [Haladaptatus sp. AB643]|uniref:bacterio-opsin activator domain-containing protein n=1 Tax=Haladaptatus sp. AB643 TaxID=2934174 RepID=UPI00209C0B17|nr:bacterio-opsin activator domain-containing protein [Haladaptatus sp. AB643]MCO8245475.1 GAF domain-containing protein [Haladaptatus sp. AB643]